MIHRSSILILAAAVAALVVLPQGASAQAQAKKGTVEKITVHGDALVGNLAGEPADRTVFVYLPPSYATERNRRYPVAYLLHGYGLTGERWMTFAKMSDAADRVMAAGSVKEMILVNPDSWTKNGGSMYSSSPTSGDWEAFMADDLVKYIDSHYRTIATRESRGLVGHSMGGYGATRIGMKHADVFGSLYIMSPCCLSPRAAGGGRGTPSPAAAANDEALAAVKTPADSAKLPFALRAQLASAAAWSPNPKNPPLYLDLPIGDQAQAVLARWAANAPLAFIDQYIAGLKRYRAIAIDVGDQDGLRVDAGRLHDALDRYDIANTFEIYPGTHTSDVAVRFQEHVIPFFSRTLSFEAARR